jgi:hypothetical protein
MRPYVRRQIEFHRVQRHDDWRVKLYSINHGSGPIYWPAFAIGIAMAEESLPRPAIAAGRPGVGFLIAHQGRDGNYAVLGWWDRENELPLRIFVSLDRKPESWRTAANGESICVWDMEVLLAERDAYVATVLSNTGGGVDAYLARHGNSISQSDSQGV